MIRTDWKQTIWKDFWTQGKSANQTFSIDKARMSYEQWRLFQAREYADLATLNLDLRHDKETLNAVISMLNGAIKEIKDVLEGKPTEKIISGEVFPKAGKHSPDE